MLSRFHVKACMPDICIPGIRWVEGMQTDDRTNFHVDYTDISCHGAWFLWISNRSTRARYTIPDMLYNVLFTQWGLVIESAYIVGRCGTCLGHRSPCGNCPVEIRPCWDFHGLILRRWSWSPTVLKIGMQWHHRWCSRCNLKHKGWTCDQDHMLWLKTHICDWSHTYALETHLCDWSRILVMSFVTGVTNTWLEMPYAPRDAIMQLLQSQVH
jgi:hypothetical protein